MPDAIIDDDECNYQGEVVEGLLSSADWDLLVGVTFYSVHDFELVVDEQGDVEGEMKGTFIITRQNGSTLEGKFSGKITGSNYFDETAELPNFVENVYN